MKNGPLYDVREIKDLKDMLRQSAEHYANDAAFLVKDPRAVGQMENTQMTISLKNPRVCPICRLRTRNTAKMSMLLELS